MNEWVDDLTDANKMTLQQANHSTKRTEAKACSGTIALLVIQIMTAAAEAIQAV